MLTYLRAAFLLRLPVAGLGAVPVNVLAMIAFAIIGVAVPPVWLLGFGLEVAYLFALATNPRFQRAIDSRAYEASAERDQQWERTVVERLPPESRARVAALEQKIGRTLSLYAELGTESVLVESNRGALEKLGSSYVELLKAKQTLRSLEDARSAETRIRGEVDALTKEIGDAGLSALARDAKSSTLGTLQRRLEHLSRRESSLREIDSYLFQIEAQVDLALESAALRGKPETISAEIDVASFLLDERGYQTLTQSGEGEFVPAPPRPAERQ